MAHPFTRYSQEPRRIARFGAHAVWCRYSFASGVFTLSRDRDEEADDWALVGEADTLAEAHRLARWWLSERAADSRLDQKISANEQLAYRARP